MLRGGWLTMKDTHYFQKNVSTAFRDFGTLVLLKDKKHLDKHYCGGFFALRCELHIKQNPQQQAKNPPQ